MGGCLRERLNPRRAIWIPAGDGDERRRSTGRVWQAYCAPTDPARKNRERAHRRSPHPDPIPIHRLRPDLPARGFRRAAPAPVIAQRSPVSATTVTTARERREQREQRRAAKNRKNGRNRQRRGSTSHLPTILLAVAVRAPRPLKSAASARQGWASPTLPALPPTARSTTRVAPDGAPPRPPSPRAVCRLARGSTRPRVGGGRLGAELSAQRSCRALPTPPNSPSPSPPHTLLRPISGTVISPACRCGH